MLDAYLQQLKDLGIYDNSTIIITADHGSEARSQMIFFMKGKMKRTTLCRQRMLQSA